MADQTVNSLSMGMSEDQTAAVVRRKLRKGTRSCIECRRRKIRCVYAHDSSNSCTRCSARGLQCLDQNKVDFDPAVDEKKTLRERVARLESLLESFQPEKLRPKDSPSDGNHQSDRLSEHCDSSSDGEDAVADDGANPPFMSVLDKSGLLYRPDTNNDGLVDHVTLALHSSIRNSPTFLNLPSSEVIGDPNKGPFKAVTGKASDLLKSARGQICEKLRSILPPYDQMMRSLKQRGQWWSNYQEKTFGNTKPKEQLSGYAARAYCSVDPLDLGILVSAFGRTTQMNNHSKYLNLVDTLIISDNDYASTLKGMECIVLQGKCYLDIGQPRRAWLTYRRGIAMAQLMGLQRNHTASPIRNCIWCAMYLGDRFLSMLLGLPYAVYDSNFDPDLEGESEECSMTTQKFVLRCGIVAGRIIDRNQAFHEPSLSVTVEIDQEMESIASSMPPEWWDIATMSADSPIDVDEIQTRLLTQANFFHVNMYLHLTLMLKPWSNPRYEHSRKACIESSRELLKRYLMLRSGRNGQDLFDCKTNDYVGFTAAVILLLGLVLHSKAPDGRGPHQYLEEWRLVQDCRDVFHNLATNKICSIAVQCSRAIELLMLAASRNHESDGMTTYPVKDIIPYFGTVSITQFIDSERAQTNEAIEESRRSSTSKSLDFAWDQFSHGANPAAANPIEHSLMTDSNMLPDFGMGVNQWTADTEVVNWDELSAGWGMAMSDIDQDWGLFLPGMDLS